MWVMPKIAGATSGMLGFVMRMTSLYKEGDGHLIMSVAVGMVVFTVLMMGGIMRIRINRVQSKDSSISNGSDVESDHQSAPRNHHHHRDDLDYTDGSHAKVCRSTKKLQSDGDKYSSYTAPDDARGLQKEEDQRRNSGAGHNMISCCMPACMSSYVQVKRYLSLSSSKKRLLQPSNSESAEKEKMEYTIMEEGGRRRPELSVVAPDIKLGIGADDQLIRISDRTGMQVADINKEISGDIEDRINDVDDIAGQYRADDQGHLLWQRSILLGERCEPPAFSGVILYDEHGNLVPEFPCKSPAHRRSLNTLNNNNCILDGATTALHDTNNTTPGLTPSTTSSSPGAAAAPSSPSSFSLRQLMTSH